MVVKAVGQFSLIHPGDRVLCALSGGSDSVCLTHRLAQLAKAQGFTLAEGGINRGVGSILINGEEGMLVRFAGCCSPVRGDAIVGFTSRGRGVVVHRADCPNMKGIETTRLLPAEWARAMGDKNLYNAHISIRATDQGAALSVLSLAVSEMRLSITAVNGRIDKNGDAMLEATVSLSDISEVELLIKKMLSDKRIHDVHRITSIS